MERGECQFHEENEIEQNYNDDIILDALQHMIDSLSEIEFPQEIVSNYPLRSISKISLKKRFSNENLTNEDCKKESVHTPKINNNNKNKEKTIKLEEIYEIFNENQRKKRKLRYSKSAQPQQEIISSRRKFSKKNNSLLITHPDYIRTDTVLLRKDRERQHEDYSKRPKKSFEYFTKRKNYKSIYNKKIYNPSNNNHHKNLDNNDQKIELKFISPKFLLRKRNFRNFIKDSKILDKYRTEPPLNIFKRVKEKDQESSGVSINRELDIFLKKNNKKTYSSRSLINIDERDLPEIYDRFVRKTRAGCRNIKTKSKNKCIKCSRRSANEKKENFLKTTDLILDELLGDKLSNEIENDGGKLNQKDKRDKNLIKNKLKEIKPSDGIKKIRIKKKRSLKKIEIKCESKFSLISNEIEYEEENLEKTSILNHDPIKETMDMSPVNTITMMVFAAIAEKQKNLHKSSIQSVHKTVKPNNFHQIKTK